MALTRVLGKTPAHYIVKLLMRIGIADAQACGALPLVRNGTDVETIAVGMP